ncbi:sigma-54 dependent transcriptional regulator [Desulfosporosinus sp. PR]|uniref:sigma-54-dependent transcriptional regulator n=1 Tax=Candidatus Desulfosporosinus nitrosoreducens TaxID=3401928 RepID=UPI0027FC7676|nr:sigma-54 dependent transcriptional regulator [Desulfosporosinus sp. PR]MDQ7097052.1 sigma-54 dependent transcriptional regulator [Desulfosporosinus sp. PR]
MTKILIIDDEIEMAQNCLRLLKPLGVETLTTTSAKQGLDLVRSEKPEVVLTDLMMPDLNGLQVLAAVKAWDAEIMVIMITGFGTVNSAVEAIKGGAYDFITKPFSGEQLRVTVERALSQRKLKEENTRLKRRLEALSFSEMVGQSSELLKTFELVKKVAPMDTNVLIVGESGTGKELIARSIHRHSRRSRQPFVPVDCAALSEELLESELFGHERGAFTGAAGTKAGLLEVADGGTLFLDEMGELSPKLQVKLLRVLQEKTFRHVGGTKQIEVDVRFVSATNRDLLEAIKDKTFREEIYYRLNGLTIALPPLRTRRGDIPLLAKHFLEQFNARNDQAIKLGREVLPLLEGYAWPGNVRELKNVIERAAILAEEGMIGCQDLPPEMLRDSRESLQEGQGFAWPNDGLVQGFSEAKEKWIAVFERRYLQELLQHHHWNISKAAAAAGINRKTIQRLLAKYRLDQE